MNKIKKTLSLFTLLIAISCGKTPIETRTKINFGSNWQFKQTENSISEKVSIPHTSRIENLVVIKQFEGISYYQKKISPQNPDKKTFLYFEGVMIEADVFINDIKVANHKGGYLPFTVDVSNYLKANQENSITVKVNNQENQEIPPGKPLKDLDFNYYGGIYRNVYLVSTNKLYITNAVEANKIANGGIYVDFKNITKNKAEATIKTHLKNDFTENKVAKLKYIFTHKTGEKLEFTSDEFIINANSENTILKNIEILNPKLWSINNPNLYNLEIQIISNTTIIDSYSEKVGIRKSEIKADGYYLNDEKIYITGTNRHQEYPYVGYAISDEAQYRDAVKIKNAGFDFVRLSHYPQAEAFLNACDELGILVMNSLAGWQFFGNENFQQNSFQQLRDMIRRDRNHPSIIFWENSLNETGMSDDFMKNACKILKEELPFNANYSASWIDFHDYDIYIPARQHGKSPDYWTKYNNNNRKILIAEYGDWEYYAQNAGFNQKEFANLKEEERTSRQLRAFGEKRLLQQAFNFQEASNSNRKGSNTIGEANWVMFDYNRGYSPDLESSGISDIFRIPKFAYYFYQSQRNPNIKLDEKITSGPMVSIASNWTEKSDLNVRVFSNCQEVALYLNDELIAKQKPLINEYSNSLDFPPFIFNLKQFTKGTLRAEGFIDGKKVAENVVKSPEKGSKIELTYDLSSVEISKNNPDVIFVYAKIVDKNGTVIPDATDEIAFNLEGENAQLIGQNPIKAEAGIATILLRTNSFKKPIKISAKTNNLETSKITITPKTINRFF